MMETATKTDIIIVGAGPTGLSLAAQLIRYGIDFVIFDSKSGVTDLSKALVVHARSLEIYDQIGLAAPAVADGEIVQQATLMHDGKIAARLDFSDFGGQLSPFPFFLAYEQSKNERLLYKYLQDNGEDVQWQTELESLTQDADGVSAVVLAANGESQTIAARYLVGCDGASSRTRHLLGLNFGGSTQPRLFYVADVELEFQGAAASIYALFGSDAFGLMFPMQGERHWRLVGNLPEYDDQSDREITFAEVETKLKQLAQIPLAIANVRWFSTYKVHTRHAETFGVGNCFLAGDAAHVHTPAGGQGMNTGIQDAYNLAWKLALALKGYAGEPLLASYNHERLANAKQLLATTDRAFDAMAGDHWYTRFFRNNILPSLAGLISRSSAVKELLFPMISQIGLNYRHSPLSQDLNGKFVIKAGDRLPYFLSAGANVYDKLREPKFHLMMFNDAAASALDLTQLTNYFELIDVHDIALSPRIVELFGTDRPFMVLLRPDNYIGTISSYLSLADIKAYFQRLAIRL